MASQSEVKLRKFARIPQFICEYHHDALRFIQKCFGSRHLSMDPENLPQLIHFDAHPDMVVPQVDPAILYDREQLIDELSIENWIIPMCATGLIKDIAWIKNSWARQMPVGEHYFNVGIAAAAAEGQGERLAVDSTLEYFVGEGNVVSSVKDLREVHGIKLTVIDLDDDKSVASTLPSSRPFILDIDMDFFSTNNPFWSIYKKAGLYAELKDIYQFRMDMNNLSQTITNRKRQLEYLKSIFAHLEEKRSLEGFPDTDHELFPKIEYLLKVLTEHYDHSEVDFLLIHDAGCTWDTFGLPDHRSTPKEIEDAMKRTETLLTGLPDPVIITISRSTEDDYCPADQVEEIQESLLKVLKEVYADRLEENPIYFYKNEQQLSG